VWAQLALFAAFAAAGAYFDARYRTIPNVLNGAMAAAGLSAVLLMQGGPAALWAIAHLIAALLLGIAAYSFKLWGGGDAKFYAATAAWFPLPDFPRLIIAISLAGFALLLGWFLVARFARHERVGRHAQLPYGLAIAAGGLLTMAPMALIAG
jgi:prepilin peptidase CpaA